MRTVLSFRSFDFLFLVNSVVQTARNRFIGDRILAVPGFPPPGRFCPSPALVSTGPKIAVVVLDKISGGNLRKCGSHVAGNGLIGDKERDASSRETLASPVPRCCQLG